MTSPWRAIRHYLRERQSLDGASGRPLGELPVFCRHDRRAGSRVLSLGTESVQNVIRQLAERAQLADRGITPHAPAPLLCDQNLPDDQGSGCYPDRPRAFQSGHNPHLCQIGG